MTAEEMKILYEVDCKSLREIATLAGTNHHSVKRKLNKLGTEVIRYNKARIDHSKMCEVCGNSFHAVIKTRRFCSHLCRGHAKVMGLINRSDSQYEKRECPQCGEDFFCRIKSKQRYCARRCFDVSHSFRMSGANNPAFINGSSYDKKCFRGENWDVIRKMIYERDLFSCQHCGSKCVSKAHATPETTHLIIQCHHLNPYISPADNDKRNLITLCLRCHAKVHNPVVP